MTKVFVTSVPLEFNDLVQIYAENESQGGGRSNSFVYDEHRQCVTINFINETDALRFVEKNTLTILSHEMPIAKAPGDATIFVYDVPLNFKDDLDCILESPRKGGGTILDFIFKGEMNCAEVTFEDSKVAKHFAEQGTLKMGNEVLSISFLPPNIYRPKYRFHLLPKIIRSEPFDAQNKTVPPRQNSFFRESINPTSMANDRKCPNKDKVDDKKETLVLRAFNVIGLSDTMLRMVLENKRYGGGTLKSYQFFDKEKYAIFSFECDDAAEALLRQRVVSPGRNVSFEIKKDDDVPHENEASATTDGKSKKSCTVGFKTESDSSRDTILLYAESKRSNGGPIENLKEINQSTYLLTFKFAEDAETFCLMNHSGFLKGKAVLLDSWPAHVRPCAIYVEGHDNKISNEMLKMFFENPRSGGQPDSVEQILTKGSGACIVFKDSTVVSNILAKGTWILGSNKLKVSGYEPSHPPLLFASNVDIDPYRLRFTGIKIPSLNHKEFREYISSAARSTIDNINFDREKDKALVKFNEVPDYEHVLETLCSRPFSGIMISVERVPVTSSLLVTDYGNHNEEMLKLYFESPRSSGGRIKDIKQCPGTNAYIIQFEDPNVVDRVLKKTHKLGNMVPTIRPHIVDSFSFFETN